jgi:hypothetical protein
MVVWTGLIWLRIRTGGRFCECSNEPSAYIKYWLVERLDLSLSIGVNWEIVDLTEQLRDSQHGLNSVDLVEGTVEEFQE